MPPGDHGEADSGSGVLFSSGLIAGGAITGLVLAGLAVAQLADGTTYADAISQASRLGALGESLPWAIGAFLIGVVLPLWLVAKRESR